MFFSTKKSGKSYETYGIRVRRKTKYTTKEWKINSNEGADEETEHFFFVDIEYSSSGS